MNKSAINRLSGRAPEAPSTPPPSPRGTVSAPARPPLSAESEAVQRNLYIMLCAGQSGRILASIDDEKRQNAYLGEALFCARKALKYYYEHR